MCIAFPPCNWGNKSSIPTHVAGKRLARPILSPFDFVLSCCVCSWYIRGAREVRFADFRMYVNTTIVLQMQMRDAQLTHDHISPFICSSITSGVLVCVCSSSGGILWILRRHCWTSGPERARQFLTCVTWCVRVFGTPSPYHTSLLWVLSVGSVKPSCNSHCIL